VIAEFTNTEQKAQLKQANVNADAALIAYEQAEIDYKRTEEVYSKKLVAKSALDKALSNRNALKARSIAATAAVINAKEQLDYTVIRAPYDGIVTNRYVEQGELVSPGTPIMEGLSLTKLRVVTNIPETIINLVKKNPVAEVRVNDQVFTASKITIFPYADKMTRTFKARIEFDSKQTPLFPGMTVKVSFKIGQRYALLVPVSAVMKRSELSLIYVKHQEGKLLRHVKLGNYLGDKVEIVSGLNAKEQVLVDPLAVKEN
jgi:RND family efflux transporter MFP subunit